MLCTVYLKDTVLHMALGAAPAQKRTAPRFVASSRPGTAVLTQTQAQRTNTSVA